jgi:hypothetical protein
MSNSARRSAGIASRHSVKSVSNSAGAVTILFIAGASIRFPFTPPFRRPNRTPKKRGKISKKGGLHAGERVASMVRGNKYSNGINDLQSAILHP